ncbi:MAG TPA: carboxypeptidase-like regulatory domain-containing protein, partial [Flavisolibacter sp.]
MKCVCFVIGVLVFSVPALSQKKGVVKALLTDSTAAPLQGVTAAVVTEKDSTLLMYSISAANGFVEFRGLDTGRYLLVASATGFTTRFVPFSMTSRKAVVDLGKLSLKDYHHTMETVVVTDRTPVRIKGDTVSFNASSFRTKPDATVEDLIRKLPGLRVDKNGTVQAQGEQVHKVYVDGKEFFSNDPRLATQNLTADMIEQVEVFDDMSEQAKFSRIDDGSRTKAINLRLKKDRKKGVFGKL